MDKSRRRVAQNPPPGALAASIGVSPYNVSHALITGFLWLTNLSAMPGESRGFSSRFGPLYSIVEPMYDSSFWAIIVDPSLDIGLCEGGYQQ